MPSAFDACIFILQNYGRIMFANGCMGFHVASFMDSVFIFTKQSRPDIIH